MSQQPHYVDLPDLDNLPSYVKEYGQQFNISKLFLLFFDFYASEESFQEYKKNNFEQTNIIQTVSDLKHYGYKVDIPKSMDDYRRNIYPSLVEVVAKAGYASIQVPLGNVSVDTDKELVAFQRDIIEKAGLNISASGGLWTLDWNESIRPQIEVASLLGVSFLHGPFATPFMHFPEGVASGDDSMAWLKERVKCFAKLMKEEIAPHARKHGVTICVEPLQRFECMPLRLEEALDLAELCQDVDELKVMVDTCHEACDGAGPEIFKKQINRLIELNKLQGIHVSAVHRGKLYESWFNKEFFKDFFEPYFEAGYLGEIGIETFDAIDPVVEPARVNRKRFKHPVAVMVNQLLYLTTMIKEISNISMKTSL